ncbi:hypothetical protein BJX63DRAFT_403116 [Aspergillus granulosus]|uniref:Uncharacterized protein n=1 Tax=Aspergillus granulosus TaxID=176169 RepID=A0ABR4H5M2_9EURO
MPILPPAVHGRRHSSAASAPPQIRRQSSALTLAVEGPRFYEQRRMTNPHKITIEITDCSNIELPRSLTESPEVESPVDESPPTDRTSLDRDLDLRPGTYPAVLRAGRRTWSGTSTADWSRHDPLHF